MLSLSAHNVPVNKDCWTSDSDWGFECVPKEGKCNTFLKIPFPESSEYEMIHRKIIGKLRSIMAGLH
jgi:hypothetical protein